MSHIDQGPLPAYNSLADSHLSGYFTNTRMRRHLRKAGLVNKYGEIVTENTYRLNMSRREHKQHVKDMLAQAIVHKTLDLERTRQAEIRRKLEEIAKIELVRRVRADRKQTIDDALLPLLSPRPKDKRSASAPRPTAKPPLAPSSSSSGASPPRRRRREGGGERAREIYRNISAVHERASRYRKRDTDILPYISPRSSSSRPSSGPDALPAERKSSYGGKRGRMAGSATGNRSSRPISDPPRNRKRRPMSALSSNYDEDEEGAVVYLDDEGRPITPAHVDEANLRYASKDPIDTRHLYSLDTAALRKYALLMAKMEQGRGGASPYLIPQVPIPPKSPKSSRNASARRTPRSAQRYRGEQSKSSSPKRPSTANQAYLHPASGSQKFKGQQETLCQVSMVYHGSSLSLAREMLPGRSKQDVVVEQQHCGGNTLSVFRDCLERGSKFSFISYRHRGYPFSLSIYIDGKMDCRVSTCCEYRHQKGGRIGGKKGHFSISGIQGAVPCYKCQVEKGIRVGNQAPRPKLKRPPEHQEEVVVVETAREPELAKPEPEPTVEHAREEQILVPVEDGEETKADDKYDDDDFESSASDSSSSSAGEEDYAIQNQQTPERGEDEFAEEFKPRHQARKRHQTGSKKSSPKSSGRDKSRKASKNTKPKRDESHSDSSCGEDESYYEYKQRMLHKARSNSEASSKSSDRNGSSRENSVREDRKRHDDRTYSASLKKETERRSGKPGSARSDASSRGGSVKSNPRESPKKRSSTYSGPGQAEPVKTSDVRHDGEDACDDRRGGTVTVAAADGERGCSRGDRAGRAGKNQNNNDRHRGGPDNGDTADEVSDIESEMAASPRKSSHAGNQCDALQSSTKVPSEPNSHGTEKGRKHGKTMPNSDKSNLVNYENNSGEIDDIGRRKQTSDINIEHIEGLVGGNAEPSVGVDNKRLDDMTAPEKKKRKKRRSSTRRESGSKMLYTSTETVDQGEAIETKLTSTSLEQKQKESLVNGDVPSRNSRAKSEKHNGNGEHGVKTSGRPRSNVSPTWENVLDAAEGGETGGLQLNLDPREQPVERGDRGPPLTDRNEIETQEEEDASDRRGTRIPHDPKDWAIYHDGRPLETGSSRLKGKAREADRSLDESEERATLNDLETKKARRRSSGKSRSSSGRTNISCKHVNSILGESRISQNETVDTADLDEKFKPAEDNNNHNDEHGLGYEGKPLFTSKITSIPMSKTGENKYLKRQAAELAEAQRRKKSESLKENLKDSTKRNGKFYKDLSYPEPVVRGFAGDSCSDNEEDETYSRLGPKDERANLSDPDHDLAGPKNYVLASAKDVSVAVSSTSIVSPQEAELKQDSLTTIDVIEQTNEESFHHGSVIPTDMDIQQEAPLYRVLLNEEDIANRKSSDFEEIERLKREEEKQNQARNEQDDVRGKARKSKTRPSRNEDDSQHDPKVHPSLREADRKQYRRDPETYYSPKFPRIDLEGSELDTTIGVENGGKFQHPQLRSRPISNPDSLAFRHSFVEEPAPTIFKPGIDDKERIQTHVTPRKPPDSQPEEPETNLNEPPSTDAEDKSYDKDVRENKSVSFDGDGSKHDNGNDITKTSTVNLDDRCTSKVAKERDHTKSSSSSSSSSSSDSDVTSSSSDSSSSESSDKAKLEIVGTRYVDTEETRYARHHKAFQEAPVVGHQEFTETGGTLSVLTPCDRSGLPIAQEEATPDMSDHRLDSVDGGVELKTDGVSKEISTEAAGDKAIVSSTEIPCLSVNTPGPEYDKEDREFQKMQREKKLRKKAEAAEINNVGESMKDEDQSETKWERYIDGQNFHDIESTQKVNAEIKPASPLHREETLMEDEIKNETYESTSKAATADTGEIEIVPSKKNKELENNADCKKEEDGFVEDGTEPHSSPGTDLMDMFLGRRRSSSAAAEISRQLGRGVVDGESKISEIKEEKPETGNSKPHDTEDSALCEIAKLKEQSGPEVEKLTNSDSVTLPSTSSPGKSLRHRDSLTATNLMDLWLGGDRARESKEKMDQVMYHVSEDDSPAEEIPALDLQPDRFGIDAKGDGIVQATPEHSNSERNQDIAEKGTANADHDKDTGKAEAVIMKPAEARRDSNYHADDDDSGSSSSKDENSLKSSTKVKKVKKLKTKKDTESKVEEKNPQAATDEKVDTTSTGEAKFTKSEPHGDVDTTDMGTSSRKSSVPDVYITTADGDKFASLVNENEEEDGPETSAAPEVSKLGQTRSKGQNSSPEDSPSGASDISGVDALIECLESQLNEARSLTQGDAQGGPNEASLKEISRVDLSQEVASMPLVSLDDEVDALLRKSDLHKKREAKEQVTDKEKEEKMGNEDVLLSENKDTLANAATSVNENHLEDRLSPNHLTSHAIANDIILHEQEAATHSSHDENSVGDKSRKSSDPNKLESVSLASLEDAETISGEDEDDAARRYVEKILQSVTLPGPYLSMTGSPRVKDPNLDSKESVHETLISTDGVLKDGITEPGCIAGLEGIVSEEDLVSDFSPKASPESGHMVTRRASTLQVTGSEHSERRKQRKLTVSFAVDDEDEDGDVSGTGSGRSRVKIDDVPWDSVDEQDKEDEYERLERELERSLKIN